MQRGEEDQERVEAAVRVSNHLTTLTLLECFHKLSGRSLEPLAPLRLQEANVLNSHCVLLLIKHIQVHSLNKDATVVVTVKKIRINYSVDTATKSFYLSSTKHFNPRPVVDLLVIRIGKKLLNGFPENLMCG